MNFRFLCSDGVLLKEPSASGMPIKAPLKEYSTLGSSIGVPLLEPPKVVHLMEFRQMIVPFFVLQQSSAHEALCKRRKSGI